MIYINLSKTIKTQIKKIYLHFRRIDLTHSINTLPNQYHIMDFILNKNIKTLFYIIGLLWAAKKSISLLRALYRVAIRPRKNFIKRYGPGSWAFVTGASDGIGKVFCKELAKMGFNIVLVARNKKKLEEAAEDIKKCNKDINTRICVSDLSKSNEPNFLEDINN